MLQENLKKIREEKGFSKMQLAKKSGISRKTIKDIELGYGKNPRLETMEALARTLEVSLEDLIK